LKTVVTSEQKSRLLLVGKKRRRRLFAIGEYMLAALVVLGVLIVARDPAHWLNGWVNVAPYGGADLPASAYMPRAVLPGGNQPAAPRESPAEEHLDVSALQAASDYAEAQQSKALIVTRHGYIVFEKYWQGSEFDTVVDSKGLGRVLAALATGAAIADKKIGWPDEPVGYLIPAWSKDPRGEITVRNLLQMSSGLGSSASAYGSTRVLDMPLGAPPGTRWLDQNADPDLLGQVIHRATGRPYADYLSESIWARIGASDASVWVGQDGDPHVDAGFFARQSDWLRVGELLLNNGNFRGDEVLSPRWVPELLKPSKSNSNYGSYVRLGEHQAPGASPYATPDVLMVAGGGNRMWLVPALQIAILRTGGQPAAEWDDGRIPNLIIRGARDFVPPAARPGADIRQLVPNH
jgi:CubicO group peptidase (beta-lactamase class C family)